MKGEFISIETAQIIADIEKENKELQERIDKAIEEIKYFDTMANHLNDEIYLDETLSNKLLNILEGKDEKI